MTEQKTTNLPILLFADQPAFEAWLKHHQSDQMGVLIKLAKKGSGFNSINYDQAVESALCYGWIDSQASAFDDKFYLQKFTPRKSKSKWSKLNTEKAEALIASGRMQPSGYHQVELAKADGRWAAAYDPRSQITVPEDFQTAMDENQRAKEFFSSLNSINRYAILHRLQEAKRPETRATRIKKFIEMLANNQKIYP
jgi:uncharacterized protein YdeI (YjbR/CyaY-like superfamily)